MKPDVSFRLMARPLMALSLCALTSVASLAQPASAPADENLWLEEVLGERAIDWVKQQNAVSQREIADTPLHAQLKQELREVLDASDRIPSVTRRGQHLYNLWQDKDHKRGLWRRTTLSSFKTANPVWETVLDLDALGKAEGESWVWGGSVCLPKSSNRCLLRLSRGGADAAVMREFDTQRKAFVAGGFTLPEAKYEVDWVDADTLLVGTNFGDGSLTDSGYPRVIKRWKRGTPLSEAETVFEGERTDVSASATVDHQPGQFKIMFSRSLDFYRSQHWLLKSMAGGKPELQPLDIPETARPGFFKDQLVLVLRKDWSVGGRTYASGSLLVTPLRDFLAGQREFQVVFKPTATSSLEAWTATRQHLLLTIQDNIAGRIEQWRQTPKGMVGTPVKAPSPGTLNVMALHDPYVKGDTMAEQFLVRYTDFLTPDTLFLGQTGRAGLVSIKARQPQFDAAGMRAEQRFATSKDGTRVPYFVLWPKGVNLSNARGKVPTLLYGYGGFNVSLNPSYSGSVGRAWLSRGGIRVVANIRGGGEFGPNWHQSAIMANKQRSYDDFIAVAEDLIKQGITSPQHLGIMGGSNGGLLVGATMVQRPDLFNAVVIQVPLLDMRRYHTLLAGASWMAEYGNPDKPEEWDVIAKYSPYQNVRAGVRYPKPLIVTSTRDDRVHPGHARKMAARMMSQGHPVAYYENIEGGHGGSADNEQRAYWQALEYTYLWQQLGGQ